MSWATAEDVENITGKQISEDDIRVASSIIDTFSGAHEDLPEDAITAEDRRHLKRATAWQAVWMKPGLIEERENASSVTSDSQNIQREDRADAMLAPLARREIVSLSWVGTRTVIVPPLAYTQRNRNFLNESSDPPWFGGEGAFSGGSSGA